MIYPKMTIAMRYHTMIVWYQKHKNQLYVLSKFNNNNNNNKNKNNNNNNNNNKNKNNNRRVNLFNLV